MVKKEPVFFGTSLITEVIEGIPEGVQTLDRNPARERCPDMRPKSYERTSGPDLKHRSEREENRCQ